MLFETQEALITETSLATYFKDRLAHFAEHLRPPPHDDTCWYIGSLLDRFGRSDQLFSYDQGEINVRPLALLYGDALEASNERDRCLILRQLGDMALFLGALFPERFARRGIRKDYFIGMGGGAYDYLAENSVHNRHMFAELSRSFARMLELVASACARRQTVSAADVLELYQRWRQTGDPLAASQLQALGIDLSGGDTIQ
jgi:hypothetical protein